MKLFITPNSPYARKVRVVLTEKRIDCELVEVVLSAPDCPVNEFNPLGKVPTLVLDDGTALYDSSVINDYLDKKTPVAHLIPQAKRIEVKRWEALADGVCDAAVAIMLEGRREAQDASVIERQQLKVDRGLAQLSKDLGESKFCVGNALSLADIALCCTLAYVGMRLPQTDWRNSYPNLASLFDQVTQRPSFTGSLPPGYSA
ncbi:MAG: glutathione S-transferase N-terminal domain-containing protein [Methylophilales bacterium]|nr:glutathione S-transferase N-terminal domain-containing protein [Methylophilales bacterium]